MPLRTALLAFLMLAPAAAQASVVKLATLVPEGSVWDKALRDMGAEWSTATQGRVSLRVYPGGVAGDEPDVVRKMRIGQLQAAAVTTAGLASIDPAFHIFNSFSLVNSFASYWVITSPVANQSCIGNESNALSVRSCCTIRLRVAPSEVRTDISRSRIAPRASNRFATFTQAISKRHPAAPNNTASASLTSPT